MRDELRLAIIGAGPVGLALAIRAAQALPRAQVTLLDARSTDHRVLDDPRTLALSLGSIQLLQQLGSWPEAAAQDILRVHISQIPDAKARQALVLSAPEQGVPRLGAVLAYGEVVHALQNRWLALAAQDPKRLHTQFGHPVQAIRPAASTASGAGPVEVDAAVVGTHDVAVIAEGGVFAQQSRKAISRDYAQSAWVGRVTLSSLPQATAFERFTPQGPVALLPLPGASPTRASAALVWCENTPEASVAHLSADQRVTVLQSLLPAAAGRVIELSELKCFALGLNAERALVQGRQVRIGNAAQTLHPVAGQGLNLGLRDAFALVQALQRNANVDQALAKMQRSRAPDRWSMIATTDFLARSFTWRVPGAMTLRGAALSVLSHLPGLRGALARHMMMGWR